MDDTIDLDLAQDSTWFQSLTPKLHISKSYCYTCPNGNISVTPHSICTDRSVCRELNLSILLESVLRNTVHQGMVTPHQLLQET